MHGEISTRQDLSERISAYLQGGGLWNPELANHQAVRDLLIECRDYLESIKPLPPLGYAEEARKAGFM